MKTYATHESDIRNISYIIERLAMCLRMSKNAQEAREYTASLVTTVGRA